MPASIVGLDIAKNIFQIHGVDAKGRVVLRKRLRRSQLTDFFANIPVCVIGMESTRGAHYWSRVLGTFGHTIRLIAPQFVKPYLKKAAKNDANDAAAICEAVSRPHMRFVPQKSVAQQDLQCLHRVRRRLIGCRTQLGNQIRGLLSEYGIEIAQHLSQVRRVLPALIDPGEDRLSGAARSLFAGLYEELCELDRRIGELDETVVRAFRADDLCQRIGEVEGIGPVTATAVVAAIANGSTFDNGRQFAAWLGLVPRQHSSGDKVRLLGITKRGDPYLRTLLIHGARSVVFRCANKTDSRSRWIADKVKRLGVAKACVAVANKNARIIWALLARNEPYRRAAA
jgi:transposase